MGIGCYDPIGAAGAKTARTARLLWVFHHLLSSCWHLCEAKTDPGDWSGLSDLYDPVVASLKKAAAAFGRVCIHAAVFKWGLPVTAVPSAYSGEEATYYVHPKSWRVTMREGKKCHAQIQTNELERFCNIFLEQTWAGVLESWSFWSTVYSTASAVDDTAARVALLHAWHVAQVLRAKLELLVELGPR